MKRLIILIVCIVLFEILKVIFPNMPFSELSEESVEEMTPIIKSDLKIGDINEFFKEENIKLKIDENENYTKISGKDFQLNSWFTDVEYYIGKNLSTELLDSNEFPMEIKAETFNLKREKVVAVKVTYPDVTNYAINRIEKIYKKDKELSLQSESDGKLLFLYDDYMVLLHKNTVYFYLNEE